MEQPIMFTNELIFFLRSFNRKVKKKKTQKTTSCSDRGLTDSCFRQFFFLSTQLKSYRAEIESVTIFSYE